MAEIYPASPCYSSSVCLPSLLWNTRGTFSTLLRPLQPTLDRQRKPWLNAEILCKHWWSYMYVFVTFHYNLLLWHSINLQTCWRRRDVELMWSHIHKLACPVQHDCSFWPPTAPRPTNTWTGILNINYNKVALELKTPEEAMFNPRSQTSLPHAQITAWIRWWKAGRGPAHLPLHWKADLLHTHMRHVNISTVCWCTENHLLTRPRWKSGGTNK